MLDHTRIAAAIVDLDVDLDLDVEALGTSPARTLMVGDSRNDCEAARLDALA